MSPIVPSLVEQKEKNNAMEVLNSNMQITPLFWKCHRDTNGSVNIQGKTIISTVNLCEYKVALGLSAGIIIWETCVLDIQPGNENLTWTEKQAKAVRKQMGLLTEWTQTIVLENALGLREVRILLKYV